MFNRLQRTNGIGNSFVDSLSWGGSYTPSSHPPAGSYYGTLYGVEYPITEGGYSLVNPVTSQYVATQTCDVDELHDGSGGVYADWTSVTNVQYYAFGVLFYTDTTAIITTYPAEVPPGSGSYHDRQWSYQYYRHDGYGDIEQDEVFQYWDYGTFISFDNTGYETEVPAGSGVHYATGKCSTFNWDGSGGYTELTDQGSYFSAGTQITTIGLELEVPENSGNIFGTGKSERYNWNGTGGYVYAGQVGSYNANGTLIYTYYNVELEQDINYYWDGSGGYYT